MICICFSAFSLGHPYLDVAWHFEVVTAVCLSILNSSGTPGGQCGFDAGLGVLGVSPCDHTSWSPVRRVVNLPENIQNQAFVKGDLNARSCNTKALASSARSPAVPHEFPCGQRYRVALNGRARNLCNRIYWLYFVVNKHKCMTLILIYARFININNNSHNRLKATPVCIGCSWVIATRGYEGEMAQRKSLVSRIIASILLCTCTLKAAIR